MIEKPAKGVTRRQLLLSSATTVAMGAAATAKAATIAGTPQWVPFDHNGPLHYDTPGWQYFTDEQAREVEAIVEQLIPADELSVSGKDAGCAVFIDRQLAGEYGTFARLYQEGPFQPGTAMQGDQSPLNPRQRYTLGLAGLTKYCQANFKKPFSGLGAEQRDATLAGLEKGTIALDGIDSPLFFQQVLGNTMEGFFADPIYGGNRDMVSWKLIGFPGARYDYRDYIGLHNQKLDLVPLSIVGSSAWTQKG
ncbi:gluconate 2-dehydrogenase subunit 3 family protein [Pseudomonas typographi]|uniref:Gluconate 2-dehydrogenase subunit 3 family protein n=1 Tax=Pseudomonas typographi TaxID=2715964 RepID=A0ABR7YWE0_9PSED|nr:gluconate 2-dehydrogenase subunit 3 family protein [Pseudomonas typographi]MBD1552478.1 gluconate 2-dehydrogenase subunit 3 family protein [Pseudomonas typographi]MBD1585568.1 gluconate 2-dehydrogenase subunit 3 family protein [Pseudomonas typographi]MBD1597517.1 gluconate 2-dehydrogenase subunit 3 family protein [Pseudomonas typographi]